MNSQLSIQCECGFAGAIALEDGVGRCFGCNRLYNDKGEQMKEMPDFESWEEAEKFLRAAKRGKSKSLISTKPQARPRKPKGAKKIQAKNPIPVGAPEDTYMVTDFYCRKGDNIQNLLKDARSEREARNFNVIVNIHSHPVGTECDHLCREVEK